MSIQSVIAPVLNRLKVRTFEHLGVGIVLNLADIRELRVVIPVFVVVHGADHVLQVFDATLEVTKFLNAQFLDDPLIECVLLDVGIGLVLST